MTKRVVGIMILNTWISPALLSFLPIFIGWYTTEDHRNFVKLHPDRCEFIVNKPYCVISSSISFWIPCTIMIFTYLAIFREANRQEKQMMMRQGNAMLMHRHSTIATTGGSRFQLSPEINYYKVVFQTNNSIYCSLFCFKFRWRFKRIWLIEDLNIARGGTGSHADQRQTFN